MIFESSINMEFFFKISPEEMIFALKKKSYHFKPLRTYNLPKKQILSSTNFLYYKEIKTLDK